MGVKNCKFLNYKGLPYYHLDWKCYRIIPNWVLPGQKQKKKKKNNNKKESLQIFAWLSHTQPTKKKTHIQFFKVVIIGSTNTCWVMTIWHAKKNIMGIIFTRWAQNQPFLFFNPKYPLLVGLACSDYVIERKCFVESIIAHLWAKN